MTLKILGLDESGTIGDKHIIFCLIEFNENVEVDICINNLLNVDDFLFSKEISNNLNTNKIIQICHKLYETGYLNVKFYKLNPHEQNRILRDVFKFQGDYLFRDRGNLLDMYHKNRIHEDELSNIIRELAHYKKYHKFPDCCLKSYSFLFILNQICSEYNICEFLKKDDNKIHVEIDGGNLFSFWWYNLILSHNKKELLQNKLFINGIAHGDESYLSINIADLFAKAFNKNPSKFYGYRVTNIDYDFNKLPFSKDIFFQKIWRFLKTNVFKKRVLLIGKSELFNIIPYILHLKDRRIYYEPFKISGDVNFFFKQNSKGYREENIVIYGGKLNEIDKKNIKICKKFKLNTIDIKTLKNDFSNFLNLIESSLSNYPDTAKTKIKGLLTQKKNQLS